MYQVRVYESPDAASHPSQLVWASPNLSNVVGRTTTGDTDLDGKREMIHPVNSFGSAAYLYIYENAGDNAFALVYSLRVSSGAIGEKAIGDLDCDGIPEIAFAGLQGWVYVVESIGDDAWEVNWSSPSGLSAAYGVEVGPDMDGNGRPELFVFGNALAGWTTIVYEHTGAEQFAPVATFSQYDGWGGMTCNALGDLAGTGRHQYVMQGYCCLWVYEAIGPGQWMRVSELANPDGRQVGLFSFDLNKNARAELIWSSEIDSTLILEHRGLVSDTWHQLPNGTALLQVSPNPVHLEATIRISGRSVDAGMLRVYDVAGHLLDRRFVTGSGAVLPWRAQDLPAGVYLLRLENGRGALLAKGRVTVVR